MRRYELMLVLRPDVADDRVQATLDRATRSIVNNDGQIIKLSPWGRRRLAYPIGAHREGSYHIVVFDAPSPAVAELEHDLKITEDVMRHLVTRVERPVVRRASEDEDEDGDNEESDGPPADEPDRQRLIDESESDAAPAATD